MIYEHIPVMLPEVLKYLNPLPGQKFIDCTLGGGGYTFALAQKVGDHGKVIALDADKLAIANANEIIKKNKIKNVILKHENFRKLQTTINEISQEGKQNKNIQFDGIVFDLGLSSAQLKDRSRGFSFQLDSPLNMAFGDEEERTGQIINQYSQSDLEKIFREYGEERFSLQIAKKIVEARKMQDIKTTAELVEIIRTAIPKKFQFGKTHPATKVFQALRIETNQELDSLREVLPQALALLKSGGRLVIVSFHSLEDRIVKHFFKDMSRDCICPKKAPVCICKHRAQLKIITKKPILPSPEEVKKNPRSRSAKLRTAEKI